MRIRLLLVTLLLAGCAGPNPPGDVGAVRDADDCHARAPDPSGSAPLAPGFLGPPEEVLARLAAHVGVNLTSGLTEVEPGRWTQWTDDGELRLERVAAFETFGPRTYLGWDGNGSWSPTDEEARQWIDGLLRAFSVDPASVVVEPAGHAAARELSFHQLVEGAHLRDAGGVLHLGAPARLSMRALHVIPTEALGVPGTSANATALAHARCVLDASGRTAQTGYADQGVEHAYFAFYGDSVTHAVLVRFAEPGEPSHCGMAILVHVDAMTGSVLSAGRPACD